MAYTKTNWQALPSTTTPINPTNLNNIENGIKTNDDKLLGTATAGNMVVNSIRTKNIFGNYSIINGYLFDTRMSIRTIVSDRLAFISCQPSTTYTITRSVVTSSFRVSDYTAVPGMTDTYVDYTVPTVAENDSGTSITYTTSSTAKYLVIHYGNAINDSNTNLANTLATMQVETGSTATTFSKYQNLDNSIMTGSGIADTTNYISNIENNHWERSGNVVSYAFTMTAKGTWSSTTRFITGLPKPVRNTRASGVNGGTNSIFRFIINDDGSISNAYSGTTPSANNILEGQITYITKD